MPQQIRDLMAKDIVTLSADATALDAAREMRDKDIGNVLITEGDSLTGIVTDRDIVVRAVAEGQDPSSIRLGDIATREISTVSPDEDVDRVLELIKRENIRRVPVVEGDKPVGIVTIGDLSIRHEGESGDALADISQAAPNN